MIMIFNPGHNREDFFRELYKTLDENPNDTEMFLKLYAANDSHPLNEEDMIPMKNNNKNCPQHRWLLHNSTFFKNQIFKEG